MQEIVGKKPAARRSLSPLAKVTAISLLGCALAYAIYTFLVYLVATLIIPLLIITIVMFIAAGISALGFKWTPLAGALIALGTTSGSYAQPYFPNDIAHPGNPGAFIPVVVLTACALVAIVAGIAATVQNYRSSARPTPRGLTTVLTGVAGIVLGAILVSLIVAANPQSSTANANPNAEPTAHMGVTSFTQNIVLVPKGSKLMIVDDGQYTHVLQNGMWDANGTAKTLKEPGASTVSNININGGSVEIGPFSTAGVYHIYCTVHVHMNLTILVE
jgi:plastocyanin